MIPYGDFSLAMLLIFAFAEDFNTLVRDYSKSSLVKGIVHHKNVLTLRPNKM